LGKSVVGCGVAICLTEIGDQQISTDILPSELLPELQELCIEAAMLVTHSSHSLISAGTQASL
jgi:hypothetical protein